MALLYLSNISVPPIKGFLYNQAGRRVAEIEDSYKLGDLRAEAVRMSDQDILFLVSSKSDLAEQERLHALFPYTRWVVVRGKIYLVRDLGGTEEDGILVNQGTKKGYFIRTCPRSGIQEMLSRRGLL